MKRPIAYVMEQTLGSTTHYLNLRNQEDALQGERPLWLPIEFRQGRLPWTISGGVSARQAITRTVDDVDGFFVHTTTIALLSADVFRSRPTIVSSDGTPMNKRGMRVAYGLKPEGRFAEIAKKAIYRQVFKQAAGFVAWSNWTRLSFIEDYGCPPDAVKVIPPGINLVDFAPGERSNPLPRILFVGGDFERKGGDLLLEVFRQRLRGRAELVLVTRSAVPPEEGVVVHNDVAPNSPKLRELFATCDVFTLPTRADCYSIVCMEALAAGMPLVATDVGGISDLVRNGETGYLVTVDDRDSIGDALEKLVENPARRAEMGRACREEAERRFDARRNARELFEFVRSRC